MLIDGGGGRTTKPAARPAAPKSGANPVKNVVSSAAKKLEETAVKVRAQAALASAEAAKAKSAHASASAQLGRLGEQVDARADKLPPRAREALFAKYDAAKANEAKLAEESKKASERAKVVARQAEAATHVANAALRAAGLPEMKAQDAFAPANAAPARASAEAAAKRVELSARSGVENGAAALERELKENSDPAFQKELVSRSRPLLQAAGQEVFSGKLSRDSTRNVLSSLSRSAESAGPEASRELAAAFVGRNGSDKLSGDFKDALKSAVRDGNGVLFAVELEGALGAAGKSKAAEQVNKLTADAVKGIREEFQDRADKVSELNGKLGNLVAGFGPALSKEEMEKAVQAFKDRHAEDYRKWEEAGAKLSSTMAGATVALTSCEAGPLHEQAREAMKEVPRMLQTQAGAEKGAQALVLQGRGQVTFLDKAQELSGLGSAAKEYAQELSKGISRAAGVGATTFARSGKTAELNDLVEGFSKNYRAYGLDAGEMRTLASDLRGLTGARPALANAQKFGRDVDKIDGKLGNGVGASLRGLGLVLGASSVVEQLGTLGDQDAVNKVSTLANAMNVGADGGAFAVDMLKGASLVGKTGAVASLGSALTVTSNVTGVLGAVVGGVMAAQAFSKGDYANGAFAAASAVGAAAMIVPGWGTAIGGTLMIGSAAGSYAYGKWQASRAEHRDEADAKAFLLGAGLSENAADKLKDLTSDRKSMGPFIVQVSSVLGVPPQQLFDQLGRLDGKDLDAIVHMAHRLKQDDSQVFRLHDDSDAKVAALRGREVGLGVGEPKSLTAAAQWLRDRGYLQG